MTFEGFSRRPEAAADERTDGVFGEDPADAPADADLVALVAQGDAGAFEALAARHHRAVVGYLVGMLGDRDEALDGAQEVFVRVFTRADMYLPSGSFRGWLFRIATNVAIDAIRSRRRRLFGWTRRQKARPEPSVPGAADDLASLPDPGAGALDDLLMRERAAVVQRAVQALPPKYRAALVMRDLQDLSYEEAADALGLAVGTVKSRVNRARNLLREKLAGYVGEAP